MRVLPHGSPMPFATGTAPNWQRCQKNSSESVTSLQPSTRSPTPRLRTAAVTSAGSALGSPTRADALAAQCGAATPALRQATEALPLTDRETEIVMLIGEGLSNRAIAERLTLSIRTVESYVYRAMVKTGMTSRDEFAALMGRHRPGRGGK